MLAFLLAMTFFITARWMCEQKKQEEEMRLVAKEKHSKMGLALPHLFKMVWFVSVVSYEWQTLWDMPWLPKFLGGKGEASFFQQGPAEELTTFYEIQLAYHAHSMLFAFIVGAKLEMHLHHLVTILLIYLSDALGYRRVGAVVFTLHDTPDIVGCAIKAAVVAEEKLLAMGIFVGLLGAWGYFRLYLLPMLIIDIIQCSEPYARRVFFAALLSILVLLHYFWYMQFLIMAYNMRRTGKTRDISETVEHPADKANRAARAPVLAGEQKRR